MHSCFKQPSHTKTVSVLLPVVVSQTKLFDVYTLQTIEAYTGVSTCMRSNVNRLHTLIIMYCMVAVVSTQCCYFSGLKGSPVG